MSSSIGNEFDLYLDQQVVDNLTLTLVAAYLLADDAFCPLPVPSTSTLYAFGSGSTQINPSLYTSPQASNAYKFGARLQWNF
jgi:predicted component of type VI protein secretion system